jgi:hypothetical protein
MVHFLEEYNRSMVKSKVQVPSKNPIVPKPSRKELKIRARNKAIEIDNGSYLDELPSVVDYVTGEAAFSSLVEDSTLLQSSTIETIDPGDGEDEGKSMFWGSVDRPVSAGDLTESVKKMRLFKGNFWGPVPPDVDADPDGEEVEDIPADARASGGEDVDRAGLPPVREEDVSGTVLREEEEEEEEEEEDDDDECADSKAGDDDSQWTFDSDVSKAKREREPPGFSLDDEDDDGDAAAPDAVEQSDEVEPDADSNIQTSNSHERERRAAEDAKSENGVVGVESGREDVDTAETDPERREADSDVQPHGREGVQEGGRRSSDDFKDKREPSINDLGEGSISDGDDYDVLASGDNCRRKITREYQKSIRSMKTAILKTRLEVNTDPLEQSQAISIYERLKIKLEHVVESAENSYDVITILYEHHDISARKRRQQAALDVSRAQEKAVAVRDLFDKDYADVTAGLPPPDKHHNRHGHHVTQDPYLIKMNQQTVRENANEELESHRLMISKCIASESELILQLKYVKNQTFVIHRSCASNIRIENRSEQHVLVTSFELYHPQFEYLLNEIKVGS